MSELLGVGLDLCEISRMEKQLTNTALLRRILTETEQAYLTERGKMASASLAAMWAAKEAAVKALGVGLAIPMTDVEILHRPGGQPYYVLHGEAQRLADGGSMLLSITHEGDMAAAVCVWSR